MQHAEHQHLASGQKPADGVARAQLSKLMFARLDRFDSSRQLTGGVCYCCKTAIATDATGGVYTAWRHVYEGNVRDLAFTKSSDSGRTFAPPIRAPSFGPRRFPGSATAKERDVGTARAARARRHVGHRPSRSR